MKQVARILAGVACLAAAAMAATWTGWISDEHCGAKGASAQHAACAKTCIKNGVKPVFVTDAGQVFKIKNPEKVAPNAGDHVTLTGTETGGAIEVSKIEPAKVRSK